MHPGGEPDRRRSLRRAEGDLGALLRYRLPVPPTRLPAATRVALVAAVTALAAAGCLGTGNRASQDNGPTTHTAPQSQPALLYPSPVPSDAVPTVQSTIPPPNLTLSPAP